MKWVVLEWKAHTLKTTLMKEYYFNENRDTLMKEYYFNENVYCFSIQTDTVK
jgi:hypothetical protein